MFNPGYNSVYMKIVVYYVITFPLNGNKIRKEHTYAREVETAVRDTVLLNV